MILMMGLPGILTLPLTMNNNTKPKKNVINNTAASTKSKLQTLVSETSRSIKTKQPGKQNAAVQLALKSCGKILMDQGASSKDKIPRESLIAFV